MDKRVELVLRIALAFSLLYPPIAAWSDPFTWLGYIPDFATVVWPLGTMALLHTFGVIEIVLGLWILWGKRLFVPCVISGVILLFIVVTNTNQFDILFRDITIAGMALALALANWPRRDLAI